MADREQMDQIVACRRCGVIFRRISRDICKKCADDEQSGFARISEFLKRNKKADIDSIIRATGVSPEIAKQFISSGKAETDFGKDAIEYRCGMCGRSISRGMVCSECDRDLSSNIQDLKSTIEDLRQNKFTGHKKENVLVAKKPDGLAGIKSKAAPPPDPAKKR